MDLTAVVRRVQERLGEGWAGAARLHRNELHCQVPAGGVVGLADVLTRDLGAALRLMAAEDARDRFGVYRVHYLFAQPRENWFLHASQDVGDRERPAIESLALLQYAASRFEREIFDLFGIHANGHPDPRPLVKHGFWPEDYFPLRRNAVARPFEDDGRPFPFGAVRGEGVYEIPVGPVHAGIIEPGHFRFSVLGETIIDMKSRLYFTHKGTEKLFEGRRAEAGVELAERVSGDTSVGHALAFCQAIESAGGREAPPRACAFRVLLLELERLYNHVGDVGAILNDAGFAVANAHCLRVRERLLRLNKAITGSRLLRGVLTVGGVTVDLPAGPPLVRELESALADFLEMVEIALSNTLVLDRLDGTGRLTFEIARDHGVLGYVARASGLDVDARRDHPFAAYAGLDFDVPVFQSGDVKARTIVRIEEARQAVRLIRQVVERLPSGPIVAPAGDLGVDRSAFSVVEGWRGAITHWVRLDEAGRLLRVKIVDPSFFNWRPLSYAVLDNIVPDFPLCNKSFNQSYSGNDL